MARKVEDLATWRLCDELVEQLVAATEKGRVAQDRKFCDQINDAAGDRRSKKSGPASRWATGASTSPTKRPATCYASASERNRRQKRLRAYLWTVKKEDLPPRPDIATPRQTSRRRTPRARTP
jgi:hypothetical protein